MALSRLMGVAGGSHGHCLGGWICINLPFCGRISILLQI